MLTTDLKIDIWSDLVKQTQKIYHSFSCLSMCCVVGNLNRLFSFSLHLNIKYLFLKYSLEIFTSETEPHKKVKFVLIFFKQAGVCWLICFLHVHKQAVTSAQLPQWRSSYGDPDAVSVSAWRFEAHLGHCQRSGAVRCVWWTRRSEQEYWTLKSVDNITYCFTIINTQIKHIIYHWYVCFQEMLLYVIPIFLGLFCCKYFQTPRWWISEDVSSCLGQS